MDVLYRVKPLCTKDQVQFDTNEERIFISKEITAKCGNDNCNMFITFMPTASTSSNNVQLYNEVSRYYQEVAEVKEIINVPFTEAIQVHLMKMI